MTVYEVMINTGRPSSLKISYSQIFSKMQNNIHRDFTPSAFFFFFNRENKLLLQSQEVSISIFVEIFVFAYVVNA